MSIVTSLLGIKVPPIVYEALAVVLAAGILVAYGMRKEHTIIETRVQKQIAVVKENVIVTDKSQEKELADLRAYRAAHPVDPDFGVCVAGNDLSPRSAEGSGSASAGSVQPVPSGDRSVQPVQAGRPIGAMLEALAGSADQVSARLRRRQELEP